MPDYRMRMWRLIQDAPGDGATNMAVDEAILRAMAEEKAGPTLRLYTWAPPCLSLGRGQPVDDADRGALRAVGYDLVRRPTGGRAILHIDEVTYSLIVPHDDPRVLGSVVESYRRLSGALIRGLEHLGVPDIEADQRVDAGAEEGPVCFEAPSDYEITAGGKKLVGSAQMRAQGVVLQHGSIPLQGDIGRICPLLAQHPDPDRVRVRATTVERAIGRRVDWREAAAAVIAGFGQALNLELSAGNLSEREQATAERLRREKYGTETWNNTI